MKRFSLIAFVIGLVSLAIFSNIQETNTAQTNGKTDATTDSSQIEQRERRPAIGYLAPAFSLSALDGKTYKLGAPRNKPLLLNFWASWCGPCQEEAPVLKRIYEKYQDKLDLYAINLTTDDKLENAKAFVEGFKLPFPILLDTKGAAGKDYLIQGIPTTFFIDESGMIRNVMMGMPGEEHFEREVQALISR
ncbi:redoxin domain-containing protein [Brevibacillus humidisoli]|uniref:TlpA family protein disulfide reductase n=1 Tax=Brevibacillus humidisoli TaxID=2895522 RepID=UPI001E655413|nr:TlpA disulfide reductase family protein [Brevibacillus humidisoli]UFJ42332.1 redoxin domain-containing protein [Brevibacillus humidisoli]